MVDSVNESVPPERAKMRASDTDRDAVAQRLREAFAEGRLSPDEHSERLDAVYNARTLGELVPLTQDLPAIPSGEDSAGFRSPRPVYGAERVVGGAPTTRTALALMGGSEVSGNWVVPPDFYAFAVMGGIHIDLREARFTQRETTIWTHSLMGGVGISVPDDIEVRVHGVAIMGGFGGESSPSVVDPQSPIVHVRGLAVMGGTGIERKRRKHQKKKQGPRRGRED